MRGLLYLAGLSSQMKMTESSALSHGCFNVASHAVAEVVCSLA